nr:hypothetical protein [Tanacetum cinerariifolium]
MDQQMNVAIKVAIQLQSDRLHNEAQADNDEFLKTIDENMKKIIKEQTSYAVAADLSEMELKKILIEKMEGNKPRVQETQRRKGARFEEPMQTTFEMEEPSHPEFETGADDQPIVELSQHPEWFSQQQKPPSPDRNWNKTLSATHRSIQPWISKLVKQSDSHSSFNELMDTPVDFFTFSNESAQSGHIDPGTSS